jgi:cytochrome c oxidase cbb3-type subunit III
MRVKHGSMAATVLGMVLVAGVIAQAQPGRGGRGGRPATFPGQNRWVDPALVARGKTLYGINCQGCHGADLRGGDIGGPNLLRSQVMLSDKEGELLQPIVEGSRQSTGMPAIKMVPADVKAVAAYIHNVAVAIGNQGNPPGIGIPAPSPLVGNAAAGEAYFKAKCSGCHSTTGDLQGIGMRISDPKTLQNTWVAGGGRGGRGAVIVGAPPSRRTVMVTVTEASGAKAEGRLVRSDDFLVTVGFDDGTQRTFRRDDSLKVEIRDPMVGHRDLLAVYTDKDIHDVTAYLVTVK